jgi:hypothetical protein
MIYLPPDRCNASQYASLKSTHSTGVRPSQARTVRRFAMSLIPADGTPNATAPVHLHTPYLLPKPPSEAFETWCAILCKRTADATCRYYTAEFGATLCSFDEYDTHHILAVFQAKTSLEGSVIDALVDSDDVVFFNRGNRLTTVTRCRLCTHITKLTYFCSSTLGTLCFDCHEGRIGD